MTEKSKHSDIKGYQNKKRQNLKQGTTDLQIYKNGSKNLINSNNKSLSIITLTRLNSATAIHRTH